jgi:SAM-dependent methyltransferase
VAVRDDALVRERLFDLLCGFMRTQALAAAARLGLADLVSDEPIEVGELARQVGAHEGSLYRLLRALSSDGVFAEVEPGRFVRTALSDGLRSDAPLSDRWIAIAFGAEHYRGWAESFHSFCTGEPGFDRAYGVPYFDYLEQNAEASATFNRAMGAGTRSRLAALVEHDWAEVRHVVDVGGGNGTALAAVLAANPHLTGAVFDLPSALDGAPPVLAEAGVAKRCDLVGGNFFTDPLPPADVYVLSQILHDWDDERAAAILRNCRRSIADDGRLLVLDAVVPSSPEPHFRKLFDLHMLVLLGGKERTNDEWQTLFAATGFKVANVRVSGPSNLIEAEAT